MGLGHGEVPDTEPENMQQCGGHGSVGCSRGPSFLAPSARIIPGEVVCTLLFSEVTLPVRLSRPSAARAADLQREVCRGWVPGLPNPQRVFSLATCSSAGPLMTLCLPSQCAGEENWVDSRTIYVGHREPPPSAEAYIPQRYPDNRIVSSPGVRGHRDNTLSPSGMSRIGSVTVC